LAQNLSQGLKNKSQATSFFANPNFIVQCRSQMHRMQVNSVTVVNDGVRMGREQPG
jgi:UDP-N-acetyl-D-mannosaminuronic acid transferase (WecB/TagA/CpsF family)